MPDNFQEPQADGWEAINEALRPIYGNTEPLHWGTIVPYSLGGRDPIQGISAYRSDCQRPHLHYVTYGFSELYEKECDDPQVSGFGFELTFRLASEPQDEPPMWALGFLQNLGRYVFSTGNRFGAGHTMPLNSPIRQGSDTLIRTISFVLDPQLPPILTPNGRVEFLQLVGLTEDELAAIQGWNAERFLDLVRLQNELLVTDLSRSSHLADPAFQDTVARRTAEEGSSADALFANEARVSYDGTSCKLTVGALIASDLRRRLLGRIPFGRHFSIYTEDAAIRFEPGTELIWQRTNEDAVVITLTPEQTQRLGTMLAEGAGTYRDPMLPGLSLEIERTEIKDSDGNVVQVVG